MNIKKEIKELDHDKSYCIYSIRKSTLGLLEQDIDIFHRIAYMQIIDIHLDHLK